MAGVEPLDTEQSGAGKRKDSRGSGRHFRRAAALLGAVAWPVTALAQQAEQTFLGVRFAMSTMEVIQLSLFVGITGAAMLSAILLIRERGRTAAENVELRGRVAEQDNALQRADALLNLRDQRILVWFGDSRKPELVGSLPAGEAPEDRATFLAFGRWLSPRSATQLERALAALREDKRNFEIVLETNKGALI